MIKKYLKLITLGSLVCLPLSCDAKDESAPAEKSAWTWKVEANKALELHGKNGLLWRLNFAKDLNKFYFHPLRTVEGKDLTSLAPKDHIWHYGLWFAWKKINDVNYWEIPKGQKYSQGRTMITKVEVVSQTPEAAHVRLQLKYRPGEQGKDVATEIVNITIGTPGSDGSYVIDWSMATTALTDLNFGRSLGYGGLSYRAAEQMREPVFLSDNGKEQLIDPKKIMWIAEPSRWLDLSGLNQGNPVGLTIFDHPSNPRSPSRWFLVNGLTGPKQAQWSFFYSNASLIAKKPYLLGAGKTLHLHYRILVHSGWGKTEDLQNKAKQFSKLKFPLKDS